MAVIAFSNRRSSVRRSCRKSVASMVRSAACRGGQRLRNHVAIAELIHLLDKTLGN